MATKTTTTYRGCTLIRTETTTDVTRVAFGRPYRAIARLWEVQGRLSSTRPSMGRRWLTSAAECREWIRARDAEAERANAGVR
jgi:hypothetical protein